MRIVAFIRFSDDQRSKITPLSESSGRAGSMIGLIPSALFLKDDLDRYGRDLQPRQMPQKVNGCAWAFR